MTVRFCQGAGTAFLLMAASDASGQFQAIQNLANGREVNAARFFFDALDSGNVRLAIASPAVMRGLSGTLQARQRQFGVRWRGDKGPRTVVRVNDGGSGRIVTLRARYERATVEQVAFVTCARACQVTAFKETPVYAKVY